MNLDFRALLAELTGASLRTKALTVVTLVAVVAIVSIIGVVAAEPHFVTLYSGLADAERVAVEKALAEGGVRFRTSNFPGPYIVYVDEDEFDRAQIQVALAEALKRAPTGINTSKEGASTIFMSSGERAQNMLKREWQETENLLTQFEFVLRAKVTTSIPDTSVLRRPDPMTVSVALTLRGGQQLAPEQAENVAKLVRFRFGVPAENVVISDQSGHTVYDSDTQGPEQDSRRLLEHGVTFDRDLAAKVNESLERAFGPDRAYVTITSEWDADQSTTVTESLDGEPRELTVEKTKSETKGSPSVAGGPAGTASNLVSGYGMDNAGTGEDDGSDTSVTSDERTTYEVPRTRTQTVRMVPKLERLNVSLVVDSTLAEKAEEIRTMVSAAVGYDEQRKDALGVTVADMTSAEPETESEEAPAVPEGGGAPSATLQMLLERGVEIASALAFVILLFVSLRGSKRRAAADGEAGGAALGAGGLGGGEAPDADPVQLARAQIEELVKSDPRRVGEILSRWASEESRVNA